MTHERKVWAVEVPITGKAYLEIQATSEEEAIAAAVERVVYEDISEWEALRHVVRGNVFYGILNEANAEIMD